MLSKKSCSCSSTTTCRASRQCAGSVARASEKGRPHIPRCRRRYRQRDVAGQGRRAGKEAGRVHQGQCGGRKSATRRSARDCRSRRRCGSRSTGKSPAAMAAALLVVVSGYWAYERYWSRTDAVNAGLRAAVAEATWGEGWGEPFAARIGGEPYWMMFRGDIDASSYSDSHGNPVEMRCLHLYAAPAQPYSGQYYKPSPRNFLGWVTWPELAMQCRPSPNQQAENPNDGTQNKPGLSIFRPSMPTMSRRRGCRRKCRRRRPRQAVRWRRVIARQSLPAPWVPAELPASMPVPAVAKMIARAKLTPWVPPAEAPRNLPAAAPEEEDDAEEVSPKVQAAIGRTSAGQGDGQQKTPAAGSNTRTEPRSSHIRRTSRIASSTRIYRVAAAMEQRAKARVGSGTKASAPERRWPSSSQASS